MTEEEFITLVDSGVFAVGNVANCDGKLFVITKIETNRVRLKRMGCFASLVYWAKLAVKKAWRWVNSA